MLVKSNGFTMIEVFIAASIFFSTVLIFIPIINNIEGEKIVLRDRRVITNALQEKFQYYIWESEYQLPEETTETINGKVIRFIFEEANEYIKGCVYWENAKQRSEEFCLYGLTNT